MIDFQHKDKKTIFVVKKKHPMKKTVTSLLLILLFSASATSQNVYRQKGDLSLNVNGSLGMLDPAALSARILPFYMSGSSTLEYRVLDAIALGFGTGLTASEALLTTNGAVDNGNYAMVMPVYFSTKINPTLLRTITFMEGRVGYSIPLRTMYFDDNVLKAKGLYYRFGAGICVGRSELTLGMENTSGTLNGKYDQILMGDIYFGYAYNFGLNRSIPKPPVTNEHKGEVDLIPYAEIGLLDPVRLLLQMDHDQSSSIAHAGFGIMSIYHFNDMLSAGIGMEAHGFRHEFSTGNLMKNVRDMAWAMPVYGNFRVCINEIEPKPFIDLQLGYAFAIKTVTALPFNIKQADGKDVEPEWHGKLQAKGLYTGVGLGIDMNRHEITIGSKCVPIKGNMTSLYTEETSFRKENMLNLYLKYGYRLDIN